MAASPVSTAPEDRLSALFASVPGNVVPEGSALLIAPELDLDAVAAVLASLSIDVARGRLRVTRAFGYRSVEDPDAPELVLRIAPSGTSGGDPMQAAAEAVERSMAERPEFATAITGQVWFEAERGIRSA